MAWSASARTWSVSPAAAAYWKVPTRRWQHQSQPSAQARAGGRRQAPAARLADADAAEAGVGSSPASRQSRRHVRRLGNGRIREWGERGPRHKAELRRDLIILKSIGGPQYDTCALHHPSRLRTRA